MIPAFEADLVAEFDVAGVPVPQGSKSAWVNGKVFPPRAVLFDDNAKVLKPWRRLVTVAARTVRPPIPFDGPLVLTVEFRFERPKSVRREWPAVKPDLSKLVRAIEDSITDARVWTDDARVVASFAWKVYADTPGVHVEIGTLGSPMLPIPAVTREGEQQ